MRGLAALLSDPKRGEPPARPEAAPALHSRTAPSQIAISIRRKAGGQNG